VSQRKGRGISTPTGADLGVNRGDVMIDGADAEHQAGRDLPIRAAAGDEA